MSRAARCLTSSLRSVSCSKPSSSLVTSRTVIPAVSSRHYGQQAVRQREQPREDHIHSNSPRSREPRPDVQRTQPWEERERPEDPGLATKVSGFEAYMNRIFAPLQFHPEVAQRVLTHGSHRLARKGHSAGLSFIGRRVLSAYLLLFLQSSPNLMSTDNIEEIALNTLHTNLLGEHVAHEWGVGRVMVWQPSIPSGKSMEDMEVLRSAGLYKVQGETVQAIVGAVYHQHGATAAHRIFHTRLLPLLLVKGGLPAQFHEDAEAACKRMGGRDEPLPGEESSQKVESLSS